MDKRSGQSLVEVLIAISIGGLIIGSSVIAITLSLRSNTQNEAIKDATFLLNEMIDRTRSIAEGDWSKLYNLTKSEPAYVVRDDGESIFIHGTEGVLEEDISSGLVGYWKFDEAGGQGPDLVTNGDGSSGNNTNFSEFVYDASESYDTGAGMFKVTGKNLTKFSDELMPVDTASEYRIKYAIKLLDDNGQPGDWYHYGGLIPYDRDQLEISSQHILHDSVLSQTTLAAPLNNGDTTITLASGSGWQNSAAGHQRNINFYPYQDSTGFTYRDYGYSRKSSHAFSDFNANGAWAAGGVSGNVITLREPWPGPSYPSGTKVANSRSGGTYLYTAAHNNTTPATWETNEGLISGINPVGSSPANNFREGTSYVKGLWLLNRNGTGSATTAIDAVSFEKVFSGGTATTEVYDSSPNGNKGTLINEPTRIDLSGCMVGSCISFDTSSLKYVSIPNQNGLGPQTTLTLAAWVYPTGVGGTDGRSTVIVGRPSSYYLTFNDSTKALDCYWYNTTPAGYHTTPNNSVPLNQWSHIACVWDGVNNYRYINGVLVDSTAVTGNGVAATEVYIGAENAGRQFEGMIDEPRIYDQALSAEEVAQLHGSRVYNRSLSVENVNRNSTTGEIMEVGGSEDPSTQKVTGSITMPTSSTITTVEYMTRARNEIERVTDWSDPTSYDTEEGIDASTEGEIKLIIPDE